MCPKTGVPVGHKAPTGPRSGDEGKEVVNGAAVDLTGARLRYKRHIESPMFLQGFFATYIGRSLGAIWIDSTIRMIGLVGMGERG